MANSSGSLSPPQSPTTAGCDAAKPQPDIHGCDAAKAQPDIHGRDAAKAQPDIQGHDAAGRLLLVIEDDAALSRTLVRSFERRGYRVISADSFEAMQALLPQQTPDYAVIDLKLNGEASGLACVKALHAHSPKTLIVVLTGFASIATAVEAVKLGACHYLAKPSNTDDIERAFGMTEGNTDVELAARQASIKTLEWERIHEMLVATDFNISETARRLGMHRRTLARKLEKRRV